MFRCSTAELLRFGGGGGIRTHDPRVMNHVVHQAFVGMGTEGIAPSTCWVWTSRSAAELRARRSGDGPGWICTPNSAVFNRVLFC